MNRVLRRILVLAPVLILVAGCGMVNTELTTNDTRPADPSVAIETVGPSPEYEFSPVTLVTRETVGGLCANGVCDGALVILTTGEWTYNDSSGTQRGKMAPDELAMIKKSVMGTKMDLAPDFTDTCPTAYDGTEVIYSWDNGQGMTVTVSSCDKVISPTDPLVTALKNFPPPK